MSELLNVKERIESLRAQLRRHDRLYYVENAPEITDQNYDRLMAELIGLENQFPEFKSPDSSEPLLPS